MFMFHDSSMCYFQQQSLNIKFLRVIKSNGNILCSVGSQWSTAPKEITHSWHWNFVTPVVLFHKVIVTPLKGHSISILFIYFCAFILGNFYCSKFPYNFWKVFSVKLSFLVILPSCPKLNSKWVKDIGGRPGTLKWTKVKAAVTFEFPCKREVFEQ